MPKLYVKIERVFDSEDLSENEEDAMMLACDIFCEDVDNLVKYNTVSESIEYDWIDE
jgi:hypothetical protein